MQDKTINNALLALRKQIIRGKLDGLAHVEAFLVMRGVDMPAVLPAKRRDVARRGHMRRWVIEALKDGPQPFSAIVQHVASRRPEISLEAVRSRVGQCLWKMKKANLVAQDFGPDGCLWQANVGG